MKKVCLSVLLAVCFAFAPVLSANAEGRIYAGWEGGVRFLDLEEEAGVNADVDAGYLSTLVVGYDFGNGFRSELAGSYSSNDYKATVAFNPTTNVVIDSSFEIWTSMPRVFYDIDLSEQVKPFVGAGVGWSRVSTSAKYRGTDITVTASENYFTYSGITGLRFAATENIGIGAQYEFIGYGGSDFSHNILGSVSYAFD